MPWIPESIPREQRTRATIHLRYEDITEDGRLMLLAIPQAGSVIWEQLLVHHPLAGAMPHTGVLPILTRMIAEGLGGPIGVGKPVTVEGAFRLAHGVDAAGAVDRLFLNTWLTITGVVSRTHGPPPPDAGKPILVGRVFTESTFTRPFAPAGQRKVLRFEHEGVPAVPPDRHDSPPAEALLVEPPDSVALDEVLVPDPAPSAFGLAHTDSNQHVNSLVYPRLFEDAALRRLAALGQPHRLLGRRVEVAYRKPAFAGDRLRIHLRLFRSRSSRTEPPDEPTHVAVGTFSDDDAAPGTRPRCYLRLSFAP